MTMAKPGKAFIRFALSKGALKQGDFKLKSGRSSRYFFNAGVFCDGASLVTIARFYADAIIASDIEFDVLFGAAYKGIPLAGVTAACLAQEHKRNRAITYNRKEVKGHGEGGRLVGAPLAGQRVLILDDVLTAGTAVRESMALIHAAGGTVAGVVVCFDRKEQGEGADTSATEIARQHGIEVISIADLDDWLELAQAEGICLD